MLLLLLTAQRPNILRFWRALADLYCSRTSAATFFNSCQQRKRLSSDWLLHIWHTCALLTTLLLRRRPPNANNGFFVTVSLFWRSSGQSFLKFCINVHTRRWTWDGFVFWSTVLTIASCSKKLSDMEASRVAVSLWQHIDNKNVKWTTRDEH